MNNFMELLLRLKMIDEVQDKKNFLTYLEDS